MKLIFIILIIAFIIYLLARRSSNGDSAKLKLDTSRPAKDNIYNDLRGRAFTVTPEMLGLTLDDNSVYGVIMDWAMDSAVATTVVFSTGDASLYLSSGGAVIGGGQHESVSNAAKSFVNAAQMQLGKTSKTEAKDLPSVNEVHFYLLTKNGINFGKEKMESIENNSSPWLDFFNEANKVIAELRLISQKK